MQCKRLLANSGRADEQKGARQPAATEPAAKLVTDLLMAAELHCKEDYSVSPGGGIVETAPISHSLRFVPSSNRRVMWIHKSCRCAGALLWAAEYLSTNMSVSPS